MPRANRSNARGTRVQSPWQVLGDEYFVGGTTSSLSLKHGIADTANHGTISGSSLLIATGLTSIANFQANLYITNAAVAAPDDVSYFTANWSAGSATVALFGGGGSPASAENGVSIAWTAFGS